MGLKQIKDIDRIIFLKDFVRELLIHSLKDINIKKKIESEKIKQKFIEPPISAEESFKQIIKSSFLKPKHSQLREEQIKGFQPSRFLIEVTDQGLPTEKTLENIRKPTVYRAPMQAQNRIPSFMKLRVQQIQSQEPPNKHLNPYSAPMSPQAKIVASVQPAPEKRPEGFNLGKIEQLLKDTTIQSIECPGPGKNVLVRKYNKINATQIILGQPEITEIITNFSKQAKIPVVGGILKAAISDLVISAVISEFVGSRFIINRINPYSMLIK